MAHNLPCYSDLHVIKAENVSEITNLANIPHPLACLNNLGMPVQNTITVTSLYAWYTENNQEIGVKYISMFDKAMKAQRHCQGYTAKKQYHQVSVYTLIF